MQEGDLLTTSGVDGIYPPGLPVAKVDRIERRRRIERTYDQAVADEKKAAAINSS